MSRNFLVNNGTGTGSGSRSHHTLCGINRSGFEIGSDPRGPVINCDFFGQFAKTLGEGIYGGVRVGKDSKIPNVRGIRSDVVAAKPFKAGKLVLELAPKSITVVKLQLRSDMASRIASR